MESQLEQTLQKARNGAKLAREMKTDIKHDGKYFEMQEAVLRDVLAEVQQSQELIVYEISQLQKENGISGMEEGKANEENGN